MFGFWNFVFYLSIGFAIVFAVRTSGVIPVFSFLIIPAVAALIKIGRDASRPLVEAYWRSMTLEDRRATIFAIGMIKDPQNRGFLEGVIAYANSERIVAEEGIGLLDE